MLYLFKIKILALVYIFSFSTYAFSELVLRCHLEDRPHTEIQYNDMTINSKGIEHRGGFTPWGSRPMENYGKFQMSSFAIEKGTEWVWGEEVIQSTGHWNVQYTINRVSGRYSIWYREFRKNKEERIGGNCERLKRKF